MPVEMWADLSSQRARISVENPLAEASGDLYIPLCADHGAPLDRSPSRGPYGEAARPSRKVNGTGGRKRHRVGEPLVPRLRRAAREPRDRLQPVPPGRGAFTQRAAERL